MAIDCVNGPDQALEFPLKLYKSEGAIGKDQSPGEAHGDPLQEKHEPWATLKQVRYKGTATEDREGLATGNCFIAHPECENNQEICPSSQNRQLYIADSKQYSLSDSFEQLPNNVVNCLEGKLACRPQSPRGKGKKAKRKRRSKDVQRKPAQPGQRVSEEESRAPIPVQDDDSHPSLVIPKSNWLRDGKKDIFSNPQYHKIGSPHFEDQTPKEEVMGNLYKLINPSQYICHVGPSIPSHSPLSPASRIEGIIKNLHLDTPFDLGLSDSVSPTWGSLKLSTPCMDLKTHSVEECTLQAMKGSVSVGEPRNLCTIAKAWVMEDEDNVDNEGVLLHESLKPVDYEYREGVHWTKCGPALGSGSFGDVIPAKDEKTGFNFAAKKIHIRGFRAQELTCCLTVSSPNIVPVYGAVREGPWVVVLMQQMKGGSIGQLIKRNGYLEEDRALHYTGQVLDALKLLHKENIVHGDIKADNILLSEDGQTVYLCDFGHSSHLPHDGTKRQLMTADFVPGTQTHMAPEIPLGVPCDGGLDVWSLCCMFLHMLNGWHPWSRTHTQPLCLKIAKEPAPLQEIPPNCDPLTREVITAGLEKEPRRRATAAQLKERVDAALRKVGGLKSPWKAEYKEPRPFPPTTPPTQPPSDAPEVTFPEPQLPAPKPRVVPGSASEEKPGDPPLDELGTLCDLELQQLERDLFLESLSHPYSLEEQEQMLSCLSESSLEPQQNRKDSIHTWDTMSSGIHTWDSQMDTLSLYSDSPFIGRPIITPSYFNGVKVQVETLNGEKLHIWESSKTKLRDLAVGISFQISVPSFTLLTSDGRPIPCDMELADCGLQLCCSPAMDDRGGWRWRVKSGQIEEGPMEEVYRGGGGRPG
ncbi:mitogen-activated protein kinase kinase kinase 14 [Discoglossus pictus]